MLSSVFVAISINAEVVWFDGKSPITYSIPKKVEPVVKIALDMWRNDMLQVTGFEPVASAKPTIKIIQGKGAVDGFHIYVKDGQIIILVPAFFINSSRINGRGIGSRNLFLDIIDI